MKTSLIKEVLLYRYRFALGYSLYGLFVISLLFVGLGRIPLGLTQNEMASVVTSSTFSLDNLLTASYIDAPYHVIQNLSIHFLGLTEFAIKLPSVLFALITAVALVVMLSRWFQPRIAIITGMIAVTTTPFLAMGRLGIPLIMMAFWLSIILLSATRIIHSAKHALFWKFILAIAIGFSIYTPLMIYPIVALVIAGILHPHVRYVIRTMKPQRIVLAILLFILSVAPLGWSIYQHPHSIIELTGLPSNLTSLTMSEIMNNFSYVAKSIVRISTPVAGEIITPLYGIVTLILIFLGLLKSGAEWFSARSYMIGIWIVLLIPVIVLNPYYLPAIYIPSILLLAIGIETLIRSWYRLFPRNPYARIAGLIPLTILIATVALTNAGRYFYGYAYAPDVTSFHTELPATHAALKLAALKNKPVTLITSEQTESFYSILKWQYPALTVTASPAPEANAIVHESAYPSVAPIYRDVPVYRLYSNPYQTNGLDVRVYAKADS